MERTEGWRQGRHLNTCRGGESDKHVFQSVNVCVSGGCKCISHCMCRGASVYVQYTYVCMCVCVWGRTGHSMWIRLLLLSVLPWWHLSVKMLLEDWQDFWEIKPGILGELLVGSWFTQKISKAWTELSLTAVLLYHKKWNFNQQQWNQSDTNQTSLTLYRVTDII